MHKTTTLEDGYLGSGKLLKRAIEKYGEDNFKKEILFIFDNPDAMYSKEVELITEDVVKDEMSYNLTVGGWGGNRITDENHSTWTRNHLDKMTRNRLELFYSDEKRRKRKSLHSSETIKETHKKGKLKYDNFKGKQHTEESRMKMSMSRKGKKTGSENPSYGTMWITNGCENKLVKRNDIIPINWYKGRTQLEQWKNK